MRPRHIYALLLASVFLNVLNLPVVAQETQTPVPTATTAPTSTPNPTAIPTPTAVPTPTISVEVAVLTKQLETMQLYEDRLLDTVYWSLTGIAGVALALIAYSAISSFILFDRAKKELQSKIENSLRQEITEKVESAVERATKASSEELALAKRELTTEISQTQIMLHYEGSLVSETSGRLEDALLHMIEMLRNAIRYSRPELVPHSLFRIANILQSVSLQETRVEVNRDSFDRLVGSLRQLEEEYPKAVEVIRTLMRDTVTEIP